jgi:dTDP-4-amino-4,6-dideoxygalactose transaminase
MIPLYKVFMPESVRGKVDEILFSGYLGSGPIVSKFENAWANWLGYEHTVAVDSGTSAIKLALNLIGVGPGDEIISTPLTCSATNWPILDCGATIKWADIEADTLNISIESIRSQITSKTKAIVVLHWGGLSVDLDALNKFNLPIVEDCGHAIGSTYKSQKIGGSGNYCAFSFNPVKHMTTISGGMLSLPENKVAEAKRLRWYGLGADGIFGDIAKRGHRMVMSDVHAAVGLEQLKHLDKTIERHQSNANFYEKALNVQSTPITDLGVSSCWLYTLQVDRREDFIAKMHECGIEAKSPHRRNDTYSLLKEMRADVPVLDTVAEKIVSIPVGWWVTDKDRAYIANTINGGW